MDDPAPDDGSAVTRWFGAHFASLHPLLQALHRHGGRLRGVVEIRTGRGLAGVLGRRLARSLGVPVDRERRGFEVHIAHTGQALLWDRRFEGAGEMKSVFVAVGRWPDGHWHEATGALKVWMTVDTQDGAWRWVPRRAYLHGVKLPLSWLPRSRAGKRIENGRYVFEVAFALPLVGEVLRYDGELQAVPGDPHGV